MGIQARATLAEHLEANGMTVLRTSDYRAMSKELARLLRFRRLMLKAAAGNPAVEFAVEYVQRQMEYR